MKTSIFSLTTIVAAFLALSSCNRNDDALANQNASLAESNAPAGFLYESTNQFTVAFNLQSQQTNVSLIKILDQNYNTLRSVTLSGMSGQVVLREPSTHETFYVYVPEANVLHPFTRQGKSMVNISIDLDKGKMATNRVSVVSTPTVDCGAAVTLPANLQLQNPHTVAKAFNGMITFTQNTETLDVCENATLTGVSIWSNGTRTIRVAEGATLTITAGNFDSRLAIINMGTIVFTQGVSLGNEFINYGTVTSTSTNQQINFYNPSAFVNFGTFTANSLFDVNSSTTGMNYGTINAPSMSINTGNDFVNGCQLNISGNLAINNNATLINSGYVGVGGTTSLNTNGAIEMDGSTAVVNTNNMTLNNNARFIATGGTGIVVVDNQFTVNFNNWNNANSGLMEFCVGTASGSGSNNLPSGFSYGCNAFVPVGPCNPVQIGTPTIVDNDGDGVPEGLDYDDNDPTIAFREEAAYMLVNSFEDLWPAKGDYDFNDLVIKQRPVVYRHANNNIAKIEYKLVIHAIGAGLSNGLALQLLQPASGNGYERISAPVVTSVSSPFTITDDNLIELAENVRTLQTAFYTNVGDGPIRIPDTITFTVNLDFNAAQPNVIVSDFFIFRTNAKGHEVHLPGRQSSLRVDNTFYGQADDDTDPAAGKYYLTTNNLPWGIEIVEQGITWKHPKSKVAIDEAYPEFLNWVLSAGGNNANWANNPNMDKVFYFPNN